MDTANLHTPLQRVAMRFVEIIDALGKRIHVGVVMAAGQDWVEVSLPEHTSLQPGLKVKFLPSPDAHEVDPGWRAVDRVGFTYAQGGPNSDQFAGFPGLLDPRSAALKLQGKACA